MTQKQTVSAIPAPKTPKPVDFLQRKHTNGGYAGGCESCGTATLQKKPLMVDQPGDQWEQEADRAADAMVNAPNSLNPVGFSFSRVPVAPAPQRKNKGDENLDMTAASVSDSMNTPGHSLDQSTRSLMESRLGHDFSRVRIHADTESAGAAQKIDARAFTVGDHIAFGRSQYQPGTPSGNILLAHELVHTIQQGGADGRFIQRAPVTGNNADEGSLSVLSASDDTERSSDANSLTNNLIKDLPENPVIERMKHRGERMLSMTQHPGFAQTGESPEVEGEDKKALIIGNSDYKFEIDRGGLTIPSLPGVAKDIDRIKAYTDKKKYSAKVMRNLPARYILDAYKITLNDAKKGDSVFLYFAGHGEKEGLLGRDFRRIVLKENESDSKNAPAQTDAKEPEQTLDPDVTIDREGTKFTGVAPYPGLVNIFRNAAAKGVHVTFISDACHSGTASDLVRAYSIDLLGGSSNQTVKEIHSLIQYLEALKKAITSDELESEISMVGNYLAYRRKNIWRKGVYPLLMLVDLFLSDSGEQLLPLSKFLEHYSQAEMEQQVNNFINALIDLGEKKAKQPNTPAPAGPPTI